MTKFLLLLSVTLFSFASYAQTQFWADDFEGATPTSGTRIPSFNGGSGGPPLTRYFKQTTLSAINASYTGVGLQGTQCWAAEDNDGAPSGVSGAQAEEQNVTWTNIDISGKSVLSFRGLFAIGATAGWDHGTATLNADYMVVESNIDNAGWVNVLDFRPTNLNSTNGVLGIDADHDGLGEGTHLNPDFVEFTANIAGSGTTMQLRVVVRSNTLAEEAAFDNIRLFSGTTLPVSLVDFSGSPTAEGSMLSWTTASEQNSSYFQVERSIDGSHFDQIGTVTAAGTSGSTHQYTYLDKNTHASKLYYRLKQVDIDEKFTYSKIIIVESFEGNKVIHLFPNPATDKLIIYPGDAKVSQPGIQVINSSGLQVPVVFIRNGNKYEGNTTRLKPGVYFVKIISESGTYSRSFIKQ